MTFFTNRTPQDLKYFYTNGHSLRSLAKIFNVDHKTVEYQLKKLGIYIPGKKPLRHTNTKTQGRHARIGAKLIT